MFLAGWEQIEVQARKRKGAKREKKAAEIADGRGESEV